MIGADAFHAIIQVFQFFEWIGTDESPAVGRAFEGRVVDADWDTVTAEADIGLYPRAEAAGDAVRDELVFRRYVGITTMSQDMHWVSYLRTNVNSHSGHAAELYFTASALHTRMPKVFR